MPSPAPPTHRYLDARVSGASQPELQLLMLDGALRFGRQARLMWDDELQQLECDRLTRRVMDIAEELVRSVSAGTRTESKRLEAEYAYIYRQLASAHLTRNSSDLDSALELLTFQRETWRLASERFRSQAPPAALPDPNDRPAAGFSFQA